jgi:uncharacterized membrane protein
MVLYNRNAAYVIIAGVFLVALLSVGWILVGIGTNDSLVNLSSYAFAVSTSINNITNGSNTINMNETTSSTNLSTATDINGTLTSITPEDIQDRRHAPS